MQKELLNKPKVGQPCNGCGLCCRISICNHGAYLLGFTEHPGEFRVYNPCPALTQQADGSYSCGIVINPRKWLGKSKYRPEVISRNMAIAIGAGNGCDEIGEDAGNPEEEKKLDDYIDRIKEDKEYMEAAVAASLFLIKLKNEGK